MVFLIGAGCCRQAKAGCLPFAEAGGCFRPVAPNQKSSLQHMSRHDAGNGLAKPLERDNWVTKAGDETRTRDSLLGRQELYQLSYSRADGQPFSCALAGWSGCADSNRGPPGPKPGALPTAPHPVTVLDYSILLVACQVPW